MPIYIIINNVHKAKTFLKPREYFDCKRTTRKYRFLIGKDLFYLN